MSGASKPCCRVCLAPLVYSPRYDGFRKCEPYCGMAYTLYDRRSDLRADRLGFRLWIEEAGFPRDDEYGDAAAETRRLYQDARPEAVATVNTIRELSDGAVGWRTTAERSGLLGCADWLEDNDYLIQAEAARVLLDSLDGKNTRPAGGSAEPTQGLWHSAVLAPRVDSGDEDVLPPGPVVRDEPGAGAPEPVLVDPAASPS